jgi:hypothetical protein
MHFIGIHNISDKRVEDGVFSAFRDHPKEQWPCLCGLRLVIVISKLTIEKLLIERIQYLQRKGAQ